LAATEILQKGPEIKAAIEKEFGSFDAWKADFKASALSAKLSGWGLLVFDRLYSERLLNVLVDEHQYGAIWGGVPLIALDVSNMHIIIRTARRVQVHRQRDCKPALGKNQRTV